MPRTKVNKSEAIREAKKANPSAGPKEIVEILKGQGVKASYGLVASVLSKAKGKKKRGRRPGRSAAAPAICKRRSCSQRRSGAWPRPSNYCRPSTTSRRSCKQASKVWPGLPGENWLGNPWLRRLTARPFCVASDRTETWSCEVNVSAVPRKREGQQPGRPQGC